MSSGEINQHDEPLNSPLSRVYLCPETEQIINCAMGLKYSIDVEDLKKAFSNSIMLKHPRFSSLMVTDHKGNDCWQPTHVNIDDHIIVHRHHPSATKPDNVEAAVNAYLADIAVSTPLSKNKPLWELHLLMGLKCVVLRVHHALGDGLSLMSMLSACFGEKNVDSNVRNVSAKTREWKEKGVWGSVKCIWLTLVFGFRFLWRILWLKDMKSVISGGDGVELWPRMLSTAKFMLDDFKSIKMAIPNATINDVLLGVISSGLSRYLEIKHPKAMVQGLDATGIVVVNLRKHPGFLEMSDLMGAGCGSSGWGNKTGLMLQPIYCRNGLHPLDHVRDMKAIMDKKKQSCEAQLPHFFLKWMTALFGPKKASWCSHRVLCNTTLLISNILGPSGEIAIAGNPVAYLRVTISSQPQAMTMHMVSYKGNADLQVMVAKDIIHDPEFLTKCFQDSLAEMKNWALQKDKTNNFKDYDWVHHNILDISFRSADLDNRKAWL